MEIAVNVVLTVIGLVMLCFGGNWLVNGGVGIAKKFGISPLIIGITVVAMGTSTPELAASLAAGDHGEIILGNVIGSNIANIGMVIGITAIIAPLIIKKETLKKEIPIMLGFSILLIGLSLDNEISQYDGIILVGSLVAFMIYIYHNAKNNKTESTEIITESERKVRSLKSIGFIGIGVTLLGIGAILTVDNAIILAQSFGLSERLIGLTVIAIGTSLPELITSVIAIRKGHMDIGIGNIIGSNIYNILMIMGIAATISGIAVTSEVFLDYVIMIVFSLVLLVGLKSGKINRGVGIGLILAYFIYLTSAFSAT